MINGRPLLIVLAWIATIAGLIWALNIGTIKPIDNTVLLTDGQVCETRDCAQASDIALPVHFPAHYAAGHETRHLRFDLSLPTVPQDLQAVYLPSYADEVFIRVNGVTVHGSELGGRQPARMWNIPVLATIPPSLLHTGQNQIDIALYGYPQEGLVLEPFHFGEAQLLAPHYNWRFITSAGMARFNLGFMAIAGLMLAIIWLARRNEPIYALLATSCAFACVICIHFGFDTSAIGYRWSTLAWQASVSIYVLLIFKFCNHYIGEDLKPLETVSLVFIMAELVVGALVPAAYFFDTLLFFKLHPAILSFLVLAVLLGNRSKIDKPDLRIFFFFLSMASAIGVYELYITAVVDPGRNQHIFQFMPLAMLCVCLWLVISRFMLSLRNYEELTGSLQETVTAKTEELRLTYEKLGQVERLKAINDERQRIMLDLHDGIGGQLVNTLAYMQNNQRGDTVIQTALEDALRDLSLMLDSLETDASISTLLGMLRTRLEALLAEHALEFDWRIDDEPELPHPGPSQNLNLLRIVQESITNVIKHAEASIITVASDKDSITIRDNGKGFDPAPDGRRHHGHGLAGMRRRAASIGAEFDLSSGSDGTTIRLVWR
ncbi:Signal transduction histidine kinase [Hoeflea phototrophica DFL-43]|uniref:Signal transduction histidine kinase n=1 Tax=Hoeflea phototrophica (strain DSM 17068 / NCIMB 14078 / DFL-43) TaxID=411684 RepID=A9DDX3_HOEPD|nr:ATP-binding protein [Hoeflea phototrophica]EDQ31923.1 Signal transduction histidine kinase [Hoeflea phototrophica DFL-43]